MLRKPGKPNTMGMPNQPDMLKEYKRRAGFNPQLSSPNRAERDYLKSRGYSPQAQKVVIATRRTNKKKGVNTGTFR